MLLEGQLSFAESSRPIKDSEYDVAARRNFRLKAIPVAIDGIAIAVNPDLKIEGLTIEQLKGIYTGQITNWQQVGGPDLPISPISRPPDSGGTPELFKEVVLGNQPFGSHVRYVGDTTTGLQRVGNSLGAGGVPGGIYYASASEVVGQCIVKTLPISRHQGAEFVAPYQTPPVSVSNCSTQPNQLNIDAIQNDIYPLTRRLFVVIKQDGGLDEAAGEAYANLLLTPEAQQLVRQAGFVPIRQGDF
jgi:phosphate transport system substrate-binding protein